MSLVLQNVYIFDVIYGSRPCWLLLYIRKSVGVLCLEHCMSRIFVIWIDKEKLELSSMRRLLSFKYFALERVDWIKLFLGITLCLRRMNVVLEAGCCNSIYVLIKLDKN